MRLLRYRLFLCTPPVTTTVPQPGSSRVAIACHQTELESPLNFVAATCNRIDCAPVASHIRRRVRPEQHRFERTDLLVYSRSQTAYIIVPRRARESVVDRRFERNNVLLCPFTICLCKSGAVPFCCFRAFVYTMSFACDICPKTFSVKRSLIRHVDSRHKKIKVFCSLCNKPFSRTDSLAHHINTMHPSKPGKKAVESKRKQKKAVKVMREQVRVKRERKRLPPFDIKPAPIANESNPLPDQGDESTRISQETPTPPKAFPLPLVEFFSDNAPADVQIKSEVHMEVEPSIELNGEEDYPGSTKSQTPAYIFTHLAEKQKRFNAADELDYTVLDLMQQNALDAKDEDRMFLLSILSDFKRVPMEKKLKVKARIVGAIVDALD